MFSVVYRGFTYPEHEKEYLELWKQIADYFIKHRGALGSCLHKTREGDIAYSRWPNRETRDASWGDNNDKKELPPKIVNAIENLKSCIDTSKPHDEIEMDLIEDLLLRRHG